MDIGEITENELFVDDKLKGLRSSIDGIDRLVIYCLGSMLNGRGGVEKNSLCEEDKEGVSSEILGSIDSYRIDIMNKLEETFTFNNISGGIISILIFNRLVVGFKIGEIKKMENSPINQGKRWGDVIRNISVESRKIGINDENIEKIKTFYNYIHDVSREIQEILVLKDK